ncbi:hypothetical protein RI054_01g00220 [Pseudoscourfieldia marina]
MGKRRRDTSASPSVDELRRALLVLVQRTAWSFASPATAAGARGGLGGNASPLARSRVLGTDVVQHETLLYRSGVVLRVRHHVSEGAADSTRGRLWLERVAGEATPAELDETAHVARWTLAQLVEIIAELPVAQTTQRLLPPSPFRTTGQPPAVLELPSSANLARSQPPDGPGDLLTPLLPVSSSGTAIAPPGSQPPAGPGDLLTPLLPVSSSGTAIAPPEWLEPPATEFDDASSRPSAAVSLEAAQAATAKAKGKAKATPSA